MSELRDVTLRISGQYDRADFLLDRSDRVVLRRHYRANFRWFDGERSVARYVAIELASRLDQVNESLGRRDTTESPSEAS